MTQQAVRKAVRALGLTCSFNVDTREYRVNLPQPYGTEATSYYTEDGKDAIDTAKRIALKMPPSTEARVAAWIEAFTVYMLSEKFQGFEWVCAGCNLDID